MGIKLLAAAFAIAMVVLLWLREFILSIGKKKKAGSVHEVLVVRAEDERRPPERADVEESPDEVQPDASSVEIEEFLAELRAKAQDKPRKNNSLFLIAIPALVASWLPAAASICRAQSSSIKIGPVVSDKTNSGKSLLDNAVAEEVASQEPQKQQSKPEWNYGGFVDVGYSLDFNHPANLFFRSRGTAWHVDNLYLNIAGAYVKKDPSESSRWGGQLTVQGGKDSEVFGFSATAPNIGGFKVLRHLGPTNVSYLAPVGKGLTVQGGIFGSLIGYDSLYAKDNLEYTRPWGADFTPYLMMGVNASYPFNEKLTGAFFVINGYWHLANANSVPSSGGQLAYKASPRVTVKETVLWGPHQSNTSFKFWRFLTDTIVECKTDRVTFAFEYIYSSERVDALGTPRALMMAGQLPVHFALNKRWSATVRPEVFWDRNGRWTLARQTVKAITTTLEYRIPYRQTNTILRLEHRYDDSRGPDGGFFRGAEVQPGMVGLTPTQHLLIFGLLFTFDR
ncbi:MAG TPA: outer membrane beta-barrel protein [Blastocatellia bacterium]|nr:outer membrane beta-barrel protein [Blastocatellia bacterium]